MAEQREVETVKRKSNHNNVTLHPLEPSPTRIELKSRVVPINYLKDSMIEVVRKEENSYKKVLRNTVSLEGSSLSDLRQTNDEEEGKFSTFIPFLLQ